MTPALEPQNGLDELNDCLDQMRPVLLQLSQRRNTKARAPGYGLTESTLRQNLQQSLSLNNSKAIRELNLEKAMLGKTKMKHHGGLGAFPGVSHIRTMAQTMKATGAVWTVRGQEIPRQQR